MPERLATEDVFRLAEDLGVSIAEACDRAQINRATPTRWKHGTVPQPHVLSRLRFAVVEIARERGHLPTSGWFDPVRMAAFLDDLSTARTALARMEVSLREWLAELGAQ